MSVHSLPRPPLDDPQKRLLWIVPAALIAWLFMLSGFALLLGERSEPPTTALEAQIIELPPPPPPVPVGLQGNGKPLAPARPKPTEPHHAPVLHKAAPAHPTTPTPKVALPPEPAAPSAEGKASTGPANPPEGAGVGSGSESAGESEEGGSGNGLGPGNDSSGARAIVAPAPVIPDDLREDAFDAVAVARFTISADGTAKVALLKPTSNPRINELLLDTLAKWQFFPAVRNGDPIDSTVDIRIPISVH